MMLEEMMRMMIEQFSQLASSSRELGTFPSQPEVNPKGYTSSSWAANPNESMRKVNAVISLRSGREIDNQVRNPNEPYRYPHQFSSIIILLLPLFLLQKLVHPVSQRMLLMVSSMILILTILLSHRLRMKSLKRKTPLIQLTVLHLRALLLLLLLLLRKSICLYLLFLIGLRRKTKLMLRR